jgi:hypothetical protein
MNKQTAYEFNGNGYEESDILLRLYGDEAWRSVYIPKEDLKTPWIIAKALNAAYERGRQEAFEDLRAMIGATGK